MAEWGRGKGRVPGTLERKKTNKIGHPIFGIPGYLPGFTGFQFKQGRCKRSYMAYVALKKTRWWFGKSDLSLRPTFLFSVVPFCSEPFKDQLYVSPCCEVLSFNAMLNLYTLEKQEFTFEIDGRMIHRFQHESFSADPYLSLGDCSCVKV